MPTLRCWPVNSLTSLCCATMPDRSWLNLHSSPRLHCPLRKSKQMPRSWLFTLTMRARSWL